MILLAFLAVSATPAPPPEPVAGLISKLGQWQGSLDAADGAMRCRTSVSSGDAEVDAVGCGALTTCVPRFRDQLIASNDEKTDPATRARLVREVQQRIGSCLAAERDRGAAELAARRARALNGFIDATDM